MMVDFHGASIARHIGRHLLDLALWALPPGEDDLEPDRQDPPSMTPMEISDLEQSSSEDEVPGSAPTRVLAQTTPQLVPQLDQPAEHIFGRQGSRESLTV